MALSTKVYSDAQVRPYALLLQHEGSVGVGQYHSRRWLTGDAGLWQPSWCHSALGGLLALLVVADSPSGP